MKSKEQILLEDAYARTYGVRKVRDSEVEQMIENLSEVGQVSRMIENIKEIQNRAGEMHFRQLEELKRHLEKSSEKINSLSLVVEETVAKINSLLAQPQAS